MSYDATLTITIPASLYDTACAIARALDVDVGGADSFGPQVDEATEYTTSTPCTSAFKEQALAMLADPALLRGAVTADYAARWADLVPPTLEDCEAFCAGVVVAEQQPAAPPDAEPTPAPPPPPAAAPAP